MYFVSITGPSIYCAFIGILVTNVCHVLCGIWNMHLVKMFEFRKLKRTNQCKLFGNSIYNRYFIKTPRVEFIEIF